MTGRVDTEKVVLHGLTETRGWDTANGSFKIPETYVEDTVAVTYDAAENTTSLAREASEEMFFETLVDATDYGTAPMGGGVPPKSTVEATLVEVEAFAPTVNDLPDRALTGIGEIPKNTNAHKCKNPR